MGSTAPVADVLNDTAMRTGNDTLFDGINFIGYKQSAPALDRLDRR
jgi:hypothetical protein